MASTKGVEVNIQVKGVVDGRNRDAFPVFPTPYRLTPFKHMTKRETEAFDQSMKFNKDMKDIHAELERLAGIAGLSSRRVR